MLLLAFAEWLQAERVLVRRGEVQCESYRGSPLIQPAFVIMILSS